MLFLKAQITLNEICVLAALVSIAHNSNFITVSPNWSNVSGRWYLRTSCSFALCTGFPRSANGSWILNADVIQDIGNPFTSSFLSMKAVVTLWCCPCSRLVVLKEILLKPYGAIFELLHRHHLVLPSKGANLRFNPISEFLHSGYKKIKIDTSVKKQTEILFDERGRSSNSVILLPISEVRHSEFWLKFLWDPFKTTSDGDM